MIRILPLILVCSLAGAASADTRGGRFGIGAIAGTPTGVTGQVRWSGPRLGSAVNLALGLDVIDDNGLYLHADYVIRLLELVRARSAGLQLYLGGGAFVRSKSDASLGGRVPLGLELDLRQTHFQLFVEAVLRVGLVSEVDVSVRGAIGFRYFF